jgi:hypothetical protein
MATRLYTIEGYSGGTGGTPAGRGTPINRFGPTATSGPREKPTWAPVPGPFTPQTVAWLAARATHRTAAARADVPGPLTSTASLSAQQAQATLVRTRTLKGAGY